jgi:hypothetical protein
MTIAYPVYSRFVMPPAPLGFHHTTTQRAAARGTWSRYVTAGACLPGHCVNRGCLTGAAAASLAGGGGIHRELNRPHPHDASAVKLRTMMAQLRPLPGRLLLQRVTISYSVYKRSELGDHRGARQ